jgi:hypothetical protein
MTTEIQKHWTRVARLGCCITHEPNPTLHHCHGGSLRTLSQAGRQGGGGIHKGLGQKTSDWLVIPLVARLHSAGPQAIDGGSISVKEWEELFFTQVYLLEWVSRQIGVNVFAKAGYDHPVPGIRE